MNASSQAVRSLDPNSTSHCIYFAPRDFTSAPATSTLAFLCALEQSQPNNMDTGSIETKAERILDCLHIHRNNRIPKGAISVDSNAQSLRTLVEGPKQDATGNIATLKIPHPPSASTSTH